jgi:hypothetical protein
MGPTYYVPSAPKTGGVNKKVLAIAITGGVLVLMVGGFLLTLGGGSGISKEIARVVARQEQLIAITVNGEKNLLNNNLQTVNANATLFLKTDEVVLKSIMKKSGTSTVPKEIKDKEVAATNIKQLQDAVAAGRYDDTYLNKFISRLEEQQALLREVHSKSESKSVKKDLQAVYDKNVKLLEQLREFEK